MLKRCVASHKGDATGKNILEKENKMRKVSRLLARPLATLLAIAMTMTGMPGVYAETLKDVTAYETEDDVAVKEDSANIISEDGSSGTELLGELPEGAIPITFTGVDAQPISSESGILSEEEELYTTKGTTIKFEVKEPVEYTDYTATITLTGVEGDPVSVSPDEEGIFSYEVEAETTATAIAIAVSGTKQQATLTFAGENATFAAEEDYTAISEGSATVDKGEAYKFTVVATSDEYEITKVETKVGDAAAETIEAVEGVYSITPTADTTITATATLKETPPTEYEVTFTGITNATVLYSTDSETTPATALTDSKATVNSGDSLYFTVTPETDYEVKSVKVGETALTAAEGVYTIADISEAKTVTVEIIEATVPAAKAVLTVSGARIAKVSYVIYKDSIESGEGVDNAAVPEDGLEIAVEKGCKVALTSIAATTAYDMVTSVEQDGEALTEVDGVYSTAALSADSDITITTANMDVADIKLTANDKLAPTGIVPETGVTVSGNKLFEADKDKNFVKADTDFAFTLATVENYKITDLIYGLEGSEETTAIDMTGESYVIPKADILAAVKAGKAIKVTATVIEAKKTITVDAAKAKDATVDYTEYKKTGENTYTSVDSGTVTLDATSGKGTINVETGNVVALKVTPASENVLTSSSVKIGNTKVAPVTDSASGLPVGSYAVEADDAKTVAIAQYKKVDVKVTEAEVTVSANKPAVTVTDTRVSPYYGVDGVVTGISLEPRNTQGSYDFEILAPTAKYGSNTLTVKAGKEGWYAIDKADVEKAVEAGKDIVITAAAKAIPKSTVTVKVTGDIESLTYGEYKNMEPVDPKHQSIKVTLTPDANDSTVKTGEITFQTGNMLFSSVKIASADAFAVDFVRATASGKQYAVFDADQEDRTYVYSLTDLKDGSTVEFATARIKASEMGPGGDIYVASSSSSSSDKPGVWGDVVTRNSTDIMLVGEVNYFKNDAELLVGFDTYGPQSNIKKYAVSNPQVTVNGSSAKALSRSLYTNDELFFTEYYAIPANYLADIAFATPKDEALSGGSKITYKAKITATATQVGYKSQPVFVNGDAGFTATIKDNGKKVLLSDDEVLYEPATSGAAPLATGKAYLVEYGDQGTISIAPDAGFKLDSVTLLSSADYDKTVAAYATKKTDLGYSWYELDQSGWDEAKKKKFADDIAALNKSQSIGDDGTCTITLAKVQNAYSVVVTTKEEYALTVDGEVVDNTTEASPIENKYNNSLVFKLVSGGNEIDIATATVSYSDGKNEDDSTKWTVSAEAATVAVDKKSATISAEKMATLAGKLIKVDVAEDKSEGAVTKTAYFQVTDKLAADALKLDLGTDTSLELTIGSTKTVSLIGDVESSRFSAEINSAYSDYIKVTKGVKNGKNTLTFTTAAADWNNLKDKNDIELILKDNVNNVAIGVPVKVSVIADPLSVEGLSVTADATANSIVLTMKGLDATVKSLDGLYYLINASTTAHTPYLVRGTGNILVPVEKGATEAEQKYTIKLAQNSDFFETDPVEYTGTVALVQVSGTDEGWYDAEQKIAPSSDPVTKAFSATTKTNTYTVEEGGKQVEKDVVFATKLKVNKLLGKTKVYTGMEAVDVISVEYPDAAKNVPVTDYAKKLQKVELVNTKTNDVWNTDNDADVITEDNDVVTIYPENIAAGSYKVVAYALEPLGKEVTATYSFKVLQGIEGLTVTAPTTRIYKAPGKAATVKTTLTYDPAKPATKKVVWSIADATGEDITIPGITLKDGKVTVDKNLAFDEDIEFAVKATAADYVGNEAVGLSDPITLSTDVMQPAYLTMDGEPITNNKKDYLSYEVDDTILKAYTADGTEIKDISFKVSGAAKLDNYGHLVVTKLGKVNITATVTDGSYKKAFKVAFTIASDSGLAFMLVSSEDDDDDIMGGVFYPGKTEYSFANTAAASEPMSLMIGSKDEAMVAHSVSVKGGKTINKDKVKEGANYYKITPSAHETVITITDKSVKPAVKYTINVTNTKVAAAKTATTVTAKNLYDSAFKNGASVTKDNKGKIFTHLEFDDPVAYTNAGAYNDVTYTVSAKNLKVTKVLLAVTKDDENEVFSRCVMDNATNGVVTLGEGGTFTIRYADNDGNFDIPKGTYTFTITPIDDEGNAIAKTATVKVTAAPAPKAKVTVKSTTLKDFDKSQDLVFSTQNNIVVSLTGDPATDSETSARFGADDKPQVLGINTKGIINRFASYFNINDGKLVCGKAPEAAGGYTQKSGITGWVAYTYRNLDGSWTTQYAKVTVKPAKNKDITADESGE